MSQPFPKLIDDRPATQAAMPARPQEAGPTPIIIQAPKSGLMGRLMVGLFSTAVLTIFTNFVGFKSIIIHSFAFVVAIFGGKHYEVKTRSENDRTHTSEAASFPGKGTLGRLLDQAKGAASDAKDAATQPVKKAIQATGDKIDDAKKAVIDTKDDAMKKLDEWKAERARHHAEAEAAEKKQLLSRAGELGVNASDELPLPVLRQMIAQAVHQRLLIRWRKKYNGSCPGCGQPTRVTTHGTGLARCPRCGVLNGQTAIRAFAPPMPRNYRGD